jgi:hypothetical protein
MITSKKKYKQKNKNKWTLETQKNRIEKENLKEKENKQETREMTKKKALKIYWKPILKTRKKN